VEEEEEEEEEGSRVHEDAVRLLYQMMLQRSRPLATSTTRASSGVSGRIIASASGGRPRGIFRHRRHQAELGLLLAAQQRHLPDRFSFAILSGKIAAAVSGVWSP